MERVAYAAAVALLVAPAQQVVAQTDTTTVEARAIRVLQEQFIAAWTAGDVGRLMTFYADDAITMAPNVPAFVGKEAIRSISEGVLGLFTSEFSYRVDEIEVSEGWAFLRMTYVDRLTPKAGGEAARSGGHGLTILKRDADGSWKVWREIWTSVRDRFLNDLLGTL